MARVLYGSLVTEINGKVGGSVFKRSAYGAVMQNKGGQVNPKSSKQQANRMHMSYVASQWRTLTETQRNLWNIAAPSFPHFGPFGEVEHLNGFTLFCLCNINLLKISYNIISEAPTLEPTPPLIINDVTINTTAPDMVMLIEPPMPSGYSLCVYASPQLSQGVKMVTSRLRLIGSYALPGSSAIIIMNDYRNTFGANLVAGNKIIYFAAYVSQSTGWEYPTTRFEKIIT